MNVIGTTAPIVEGLGQGVGLGVAAAIVVAGGGQTVAAVSRLASLLAAALRIPAIASGVKADILKGWDHIFKAKHLWHNLGSPHDVADRISRTVAQQFAGGTLRVSSTGHFTISEVWNGYTVEITGRVVNNAPRVSNAWVVGGKGIGGR